MAKVWKEKEVEVGEGECQSHQEDSLHLAARRVCREKMVQT